MDIGTIALLGITHPHALAHLRTLQRLPEVRRILLWDPDPLALAAAQQAQPERVALATTDLDELLGDKELAYAVVCAPTDESPAVCERALLAGAHVLAEKPIGRDPAEVERVVRAAERAGRRLGVCYQNRYHPITREARTLLAAGAIGPLVSIEIRMLTTQVRFRDPAHWLFQRARAGGGVLSWLGCHYLDMMRYVAQDEIVAVAAEVATRSGEAIDVEDVATLALRFRSGAVGSLHIAYVLAMHGGGYHNRGGYDTQFGFYGREGRLRWSGETPRLQIESAGAAWADAPLRTIEYEVAETPAYGGVYGEAFVRDFIAACQVGGRLPADGLDALQVARVIAAAYESSASGRRVAIAPPSE